MSDLDPSEAESFEALVECLKQLHTRADGPTYRKLEQQTVHASGLLPGTRLERARLTRSTLSDVLNARKFPSKAFLLTFVEACGIDLAHDPRWGQAWNRLADQGKQAGLTADEVERLRLENEELRQRLAEAERRAEPARAQIQNQLDRHPAVAGEWAEEGWQDAFDPDVIRQWLDVTPTPTMRDLTELRRAIEPLAGFLAAKRAAASACRELVLLSRQLQELGEDDKFSENTPAGRRIRDDYQNVDARFHEALLKGSQNEMFYALREPVRQALSYRIHREWAGIRGPGSGAGGTKRFPPRPAPLSLWLHRGLAAAVGQGDPGAAETFSRAILAEIGADPLSPADGTALEDALEPLDPGAADVGGTGWERFRYAIKAAVLSSAASAAVLGPVVVMGAAGCGTTSIGQLLAGSLGLPYADADSFHPAGRVVVSCSALRRSYREALRQSDPRAWFLHLAIDREIAAGRAAASLADSHFANLEPLHEGEAGLTVDAALPPEQILATAIEALAAAGRP
jgi:gluconate kinase/DNA-binding FadR family transcriptional regulator